MVIMADGNGLPDYVRFDSNSSRVSDAVIIETSAVAARGWRGRPSRNVEARVSAGAGQKNRIPAPAAAADLIK